MFWSTEGLGLVAQLDMFYHLHHEVLCHLCMAGLYANLKKCKFHMDTVEYLRFILSPKGLQMDPTKVSMIQDWPEPWKVRDVQAFLGFANFCHAPSWLDPGELSHMHIHLTTDRDLTQLNALPCVGNAEYSPTWTSPTSTDISGQAGMVR